MNNKKTNNNIFFAGQITGVEGYVESTAIGLLAGLFTSAQIQHPENEQEIMLSQIGRKNDFIGAP